MTHSIQTTQAVVAIRPAVQRDAAAVFHLRLAALAAHPEAFGADYDRTAAESDQVWVERIAAYNEQDKGILAVAQVDEELVGMAGLICGNWPKTRHSASIFGVYVNESWRGWRIAGAMIEECLAWARLHGVSIIKLAVVSTNASAIRSYLNLGFSVYGVDPKALCWKDQFYDELLMAKNL